MHELLLFVAGVHGIDACLSSICVCGVVVSYVGKVRSTC